MLEPRQLNETDQDILAFLAADGGRVTPSWVAEETDNARAYVSQRLKRLVEHGHVRRDGRRRTVRPRRRPTGGGQQQR